MSDGSNSPITQLLAAVSQGGPNAVKQLYDVIYPELLAIAHAQLRGERPGRDLQTTILVHEAYFRLAGDDLVAWENRRHFFGAAGNAMRRTPCSWASSRHLR